MENKEIINKMQDFQIERMQELHIPYDVIQLPSKGKLYPSKMDSIEVYYLTAEDEDIMTSPGLLQSGKVIDVLLQRKIKTPGVNIGDLLIGDRNAIILHLRRSAYGDEFQMTLSDPSTQQPFDATINLAELELNELILDPDDKGEFTFELPKSKKMVKFKLLTHKDEGDISEQNDQMKKLRPLEGDKLSTLRLQKMIKEVDGERNALMIAREIKQMSILDAQALRTYISAVEPDVNTRVQVEAPSKTFLTTNLSIVSITLSLLAPYLGL